MKTFLNSRVSIFHLILIAIIVSCMSRIELGKLFSIESALQPLLIEPVVIPTYFPLGGISLQEGQVSVLYRLNDGWVLDISIKGNQFNNADSRYFARSIDPIFVDGTDEIIHKILIQGTPDLVRNATSSEIIDFEAEDIEQGKQEELDGINRRIDQSPQFRKFVKALIKLLRKEFNRSRILDGVVTLTEQQMLTALKNELSKND